MSAGKIGVLVFWLLSGGCVLFGGDSMLASAGRFAFFATLVVHLIEFLAMRSVMEKAGGPMGGHFVQTMIYGLFHWSPLREAQQAEASGGPG